MSSDSDYIALGVREISKTFGATRALIEASFEVRASTVHGLLGENGSGKSTLVKVLSGYHVPDPGGSVEAWGDEIRLPVKPGGFRELGIAFVHQSLGLAPALSVTENLMVASVTRPKLIRIHWRRQRDEARRTLAAYGLELEVTDPVESLSRSEQAMLAIVRAVEEFRESDGSWRRGVLVLDEPTASFALPEKEWLYRTIKALTAEGGAALLISHDIDEILEITDEVTVLRDGQVRATRATADVNGTDLAELIVGRQVTRGAQARRWEALPTDVEPLASIEGLSGEVVDGVSFQVAVGEVLGITGLAGSGFEEILLLLFGAVRATDGILSLDGNTHQLSDMSPRKALSLNVALVPGDRERAGCVLELSITDNATLCSLETYRTHHGLRRPRMTASATEAIGRYGIRATGASSAVGSLSGGNQQKVLLAKWLASEPTLLLLQEPTVGLDVGARMDIFALVREVAAQGRSVICASADWEQLAEICNRVLIVSRGRVAAEVGGADLDETAIGHACYRASARLTANGAKAFDS
jgi:ribose transport system ATP-binding protein